MKKLTKTIGLMCMAAMVAFTASSCKKSTEENAEFEVGLSQVEGFATGDRAYIDIANNCALTWNEGDQIMVYNLAKDYTKSVARVFTAVPNSEGLTRTRFKGRPVGAKKDIGYFYFYPSDKASGTLQEDNRETFTVDNRQEYNESLHIDKDALVMACTVNSISDSFTMDHIFGVLNLRLTSNTGKRVKNIVVTDRIFNLTGTMSLKIPGVDSEKLQEFVDHIYNGDTGYESQLDKYLKEDLGYESHGDGKTITLDCSKCDNNLGVLLGADTKYFFIPLRPGALHKGFDIVINYMDNTHSDIHSPESETSHFYCIRPRYFTNITFGD